MTDQLLGRGKFGEVFVGDWMGTPVAVKRLYNFDVKENFDLFQAEIKVHSAPPPPPPSHCAICNYPGLTMPPRCATDAVDERPAPPVHRAVFGVFAPPILEGAELGDGVLARGVPRGLRARAPQRAAPLAAPVVRPNGASARVPAQPQAGVSDSP